MSKKFYFFGFSLLILMYAFMNYQTIKIELPSRIGFKFIKNESISKHEKWIVITSINEPTEQVKFLSNIDQFQLLVVGDRKTNQSWKWKNAIFLNLDDQTNLNYKIFKLTPLNSYTRKNIGYLYAIEHGAKFIYDTDDDNKPIVNLNEYFNFEENDYGLMFDSNAPRVLNPYAHFGQPLIWPRGYPLSEISNNHYNNYVSGQRKSSFVQQGVVNGDPDVDAIFRLTKSMKYKKIDLKFDSTSPSIQFPLKKFTPYNSQNTLFRYEAMWSLYLPKTVSFRLTDIWRSYWAQRLMWLLNGTVTFNGPNAYQQRNSHSYLEDYIQEKDMYLKTEKLIQFLFDWDCFQISFYDCVIDLSKQMAIREFWSHDEVDGIEMWLQDLTQIGYIEPNFYRSNLKTLTQMFNLNYSSIIDDHIRVRYTPKFQKSIDFDNFCCKNESLSFEELHDKFVSLKYLRKFCDLSNFTLNYKTNQLESSLEYRNYVLLITFNIAIRPSTIELISHIYGSYFENIIFCGKNINKFLNESQGNFKKFDSFTFLDVDTVNGYFHYFCMNKAIEMNFNTNGILLMSDDVLLKYWNLEKFNQSKIWFVENINCSLNVSTQPASLKNWMWWDGPLGRYASQNLVSHINKLNKSNGSILDNYIKNIRSNSNQVILNSSSILKPHTNICFPIGSDIFYLPNAKFKSFHLISSLFRYFNVFLELAVPSILGGLDANANIEIIKGYYLWHGKNVFDVYKEIDFYHPCKLINYEASNLGYNFCKKFIQDKLNHF